MASQVCNDSSGLVTFSIITLPTCPDFMLLSDIQILDWNVEKRASFWWFHGYTFCSFWTELKWNWEDSETICQLLPTAQLPVVAFCWYTPWTFCHTSLTIFQYMLKLLITPLGYVVIPHWHFITLPPITCLQYRLNSPFSRLQIVFSQSTVTSQLLW